MSATNRGAPRVEHDAYQTPNEAIAPIMREIAPAQFDRCTFLEPARGEGNIYRHLPAARTQWAEIKQGADYFAIPYRAEIGITNPPFTAALEFAIKMLAECETVILLQRLNWLGSGARREFWQANPPTHLFPLAKRPAFVDTCSNKVCKISYPLGTRGQTCPACGGKIKGGTDSTDYAWFAWDRGEVFTRKPGVYVL